MSVFSKNNYISLLKFAQRNGYEISPVKNVKKARHPVILLRHDLDLDLNAGLEMAKLEAKMTIKSTYFILLFNNFYNPLSPNGKRMIRKIKDLGHEIGLHWDSRDYIKNKNNIKRNIQLLEEIIDEKVFSASQHEPVQTSQFTVGKFIKYEVYRDFNNLTYISDSSMKWRKVTPWDIIDAKKSMHLLIHPFWWMKKGNSILEKFENFKIERGNIDTMLVDKYRDDTLDFLKNRNKLDMKHSKRIKNFS